MRIPRSRRLIGILASLAIVGTIFAAGAAPVSGHSSAIGHFYQDCQLTADPDGIVIARNSSAVGRIDAAGATLEGRTLHPCTNETGSTDSKSLVLAANLQGTGPNGVYNFAQLGLGKFDHPGATSCRGWISDQTTFVFTESPLSNGNMCRADWVDLNNNGTIDNPIAGHTYYMTIAEYNVASSDYWRYCVDDLDDAYAGDCYNTIRTSSDGGLAGTTAAWWGCEVGGRDNAIGVNSGETGLDLREMQYSVAGSGTWIYTESSLAFNGWGPSIYQHYEPGQSQNGLGEHLNCYTSFHALN